MKNQITTLLFDLDGTILDTNELIIRSFLHALDGIVPAGFGAEQMIPIMGQPLVTQLQKFSGLTEVSHLVPVYREYNLRMHDEMVKAFPHVDDVLGNLKRSGFKLGVVTTKMRLTTDRGLNLTGLERYMDSVVTLDDVTEAKPHPEPVLKAMAELKADPASTLMIGDSPADIGAAKAAGAIAVGVAWSLKGGQVLREYGADHIIDDMRDLYALVGLEREAFEKG
ncbi:pyrophosphatase PpaX [Paenibacillus beijingensis]|uniref:Pyrophosphatase n=1 Tax=Paenibacillus beijingensis TaxID=1126833 RepID=A0A0D5NJ44_9BACL|nr:pyrophosphatase PpaX [Paenibacillus beijingensis]AJY75017.1 pyrophosphatase [Paenibacillus beijingensis]